jgi:hypothetical protein
MPDAGEEKDVKEPPSSSRLALKNERNSELGEGRVRVD